MDSQIIKLDWDTNYFGVKAAKVILNKQFETVNFEKLVSKCNEFDFITIVNGENNSINNYLIGKYTSGFLVDVNVQFLKTVKSNRIPSSCRIFNNFEYNLKILEIANSEFTFSRFYNDPNLNEKLSKEIYLNWVKNSFNKENKFFIVAQEKDIVQGFLLFSFIDELITIELISLSKSSQGMGIGTELLDCLEAFAISRGLKKIVVGTQIDNEQAVNFYMRKGFNFNSKSSIYHYWPKLESVKSD